MTDRISQVRSAVSRSWSLILWVIGGLAGLVVVLAVLLVLAL